MAYEFALLRQTVEGMIAKPRDLDHYLLSKHVQGVVETIELTDEERARHKQRNIEMASAFGFKPADND